VTTARTRVGDRRATFHQPAAAPVRRGLGTPRPVIYLTLAELLLVAERALGGEASVRDHGLLQSALARPQASAFEDEAYPSLDEKAAALLHSLARNHALVDGNERLALAAPIAFLGSTACGSPSPMTRRTSW
jgi:hypothetical protein